MNTVIKYFMIILVLSLAAGAMHFYDKSHRDAQERAKADKMRLEHQEQVHQELALMHAEDIAASKTKTFHIYKKFSVDESGLGLWEATHGYEKCVLLMDDKNAPSHWIDEVPLRVVDRGMKAFTQRVVNKNTGAAWNDEVYLRKYEVISE